MEEREGKQQGYPSYRPAAFLELIIEQVNSLRVVSFLICTLKPMKSPKVASNVQHNLNSTVLVSFL